MDESKPNQTSDKGVEAPNVPERDKDETETLVQNKNLPSLNRETHGLRDDIDVNTPVRDVKGPKVFERVKEEFDAIKEAIHQRKLEKSQDSPSSVKRGDATFKETKKQSSLADQRGSPSHRRETHGRGEDIDADIPISEFKGPNIFHRAKEEIEAIVDTIHSKRESDHDTASPRKQSSLADQRGSPRHHKETHGRGDDIDADIPVSEFKGPNIFHRAKEEIEAIVDTIHSKRESDHDAASPKKQSSLADQRGSPSHRRETHGRGEDIDADIPIGEFKGPNIFHRAKEEIEAIVHSKKESDQYAASPKKDGFRASISKKLHKTRNRD